MNIINKIKPIAYCALLLGSTSCLASEMQLAVPDLVKDGFTNKFIYNQFGCQGENISPNISWHNVPKDAKSLVVTMYDPDAPTGSGWWHWTVVNIPVDVTALERSAGNNPDLLPKGSQVVRNDFGVVSYGGPCPPEKSDHRYQFTLYALDIDHIDVNEQTTPALIGFMVNSHLISKATVTYNYSR